MADDRKVRINITTAADTKGSDAAAKSLERVADAEKEIDRNTQALEDLTRAERKAAASAIDLASAQAKVVVAQDQVASSATKKNAAVQAAVAPTRNLGSAIAQAGFQAQDFAVQVSNGTSALTALAQQGSQLLGIFGPGGAIAGALLALGAIAVKAFTEMGESAEEAQEKAAKAADELMELAEAMGAENFKNFSDEMGRASARALSLYDATVDQNQAIRDQRTAQDEIADGWRKAQKAAFDYLAATDPNFDADAANRALDGAQRLADRDSSIQAEQDRADQARDVYSKIFAEREELLRQEAELLARRDELEKKQAETQYRINQLRDAQGDSNVNEGRIETLAVELAQLQSDLEGTNAAITEKLGEVKDLSVRGAENARVLQNVLNETATNISRISEQYDAQESAERAKAATEQVKKGAESLQKFVTDFDAITPLQQQAESDIAAAIADGKITAEEMLRVSNALKTLQGSLRTGQEGNAANIQSLIELSASLMNTQAQQRKEIEALQRRAGVAPQR